MHVHLVFVTKYRRFTKKILDALRPIFFNVCRDFEAPFACELPTQSGYLKIGKTVSKEYRAI
jgi:REP element-mobilizing transposase RayT